jgi:putative hydrolase of the HAD superfamily
MNPRAILFDLGRVLVDFDMSGCEALLQSRSRVDMGELMRVVWGSGVARAYERGEATAADFYSHVKTHAGLEMTFAEFMKCWTEVFDPVPILPPHFLPAIAARFPLTLVSNTNEAHAVYVRDNYDVFGHFTNLVFSYEVGSLKPDPGIFRRAIEVSGFSPPELLFIDDREENVEAASGLGIRAHRFDGVDSLAALFFSIGVDLEFGPGGGFRD